MNVHIDPTISLGTALHLLILILVLRRLLRSVITRMDSIEGKQDLLIEHINHCKLPK